MGETAEDVQKALREIADPEDAAFLQRFFKTGPGQYGEGDLLIGVRVPATRRIARRFEELPLPEIERLLSSEVHEDRLSALLIMVRQFERAGKARTRDAALRAELADAYLAAVRRGRVNNWDLVDASAEYLLGQTLLEGEGGEELLASLAASPVLWERRVAVLATFAFIKAGDAGPTLDLAQRLLDDREDLMQKAVGWMLREVGKRVDRDLLTGFLDRNAGRMPRTMLSYATEHLEPEARAAYRTVPRAAS